MSRTLVKISDDYLVRIYKGTTHLRLFLFLSIGVVLCSSFGFPPLWFCVGGMVAFVALLVSFFVKCKRIFAIALPLFLVSFGGVWTAAPLFPFANFSEDGARPVSTPYSIEILTPQRVVGKHFACDAYLIPLQTDHDPSLPKSYKIRLNTDTSLHLRVGQRFSAGLRVYIPRYRGGEFNYPLYLYRNGYAGVAWLGSSVEISNSTFAPSGRMTDVRQWIVERYSAMGISDDNLSILSAITFGERPSVDVITQNFRDAGVAHILVVSGMHVGFLFLLIMLIYKRYRRWWVVFCGVLLLWSYALLVGLTPSVLRATLMFTLMLMMRMSGGSYSSLNALSLAAIILLIANPMVIYNVSFQMSFLAVLSIILFYHAIPSLKFSSLDELETNHIVSVYYVRRIMRSLITMLYDTARLSLTAQLLVTPVVIYYFHTFPIYFLLTNVAVTLLTPIIFLGGFATLIPLVGKLAAFFVNWVITIDYSIVKFIASLPYSTLHFDITFPSTIALIILFLALANTLRSRFSFSSLAVFLALIPIFCFVSLV